MTATGTAVPRNQSPMSTVETMIRLEEVEKVYRTDRIETVALTNVNLSIGTGEFVSIRDRVEALGGRLSIESEHAQCVRISGSLPLLR